MTDDDSTGGAELSKHIVDARGLIVPGITARTIGKAEWRQIERDNAEAG